MFNIIASPSLRRRRRNRLYELTPGLEALEVRVVPSSVIAWTGGGVDANWLTGQNWLGGAAPATGDSVMFPSTASRLSNFDNLGAMSFAEITVSGGYSISGDQVTLTGSSGVAIDSTTGTNSISNAIVLGATNLSLESDVGQLTLGRGGSAVHKV